MKVSAVVAMVVAGAVAIRGPPRVERREVQLVVKEGQTARLKCPIGGSPLPLVTWTRDGEGIGWSWTRYRQNRRNLKIRHAAKGDTGPYVCKGTNGFGTAEVTIHLVVIDPTDFPGMTAADLATLAPPTLAAATLHQPEELAVAAGDQLRLSCAAGGFPTPLYSWYKDGEVRRGSSAELVLPRAHRGHAGLWACRAQNMVGSVGRTFRVRVEEEQEGEELRVVEGEEAVLQCRVSGAQEPKVRWLRRLGQEGRQRRMMEEVISVGREQYQLLDSGLATTTLGPNSWLATLTLPRAAPAHAGPYICFVDGRAGFHFSSTRLVVRPRGTQVEGEDKAPMVALGLTLVLLLALALTAAIFCLVHRRPKAPASLAGEEVQVQRKAEEWRLERGEHTIDCRLEQLLEVPLTQLQLNVSMEEMEEEGEEEEEEERKTYYSPIKSRDKFNRSFHSYS